MEISVFISGSFEKHYDGLKKKIREFEEAGFTVLSPKTPIVTPAVDPVFLRGYNPGAVRLIENNNATELDAAIKKSDVLFIYNPDGYTDPTIALSYGLAFGYNKPIFAEKEIKDVSLQQYACVTAVDKIKARVLKDKRRQTA
jgi:hypothetical protein